MSKELIPPEYYEDEYKRLYNEVHFEDSLINVDTANGMSHDHIQQRRKRIKQNRTQIVKDLNRTFTKSPIFKEGTKYRGELMDVLEVISFKYTGIGYVQGMNYIVACILYHASPPVTLGLMTHLIEDFQL